MYKNIQSKFDDFMDACVKQNKPPVKTFKKCLNYYKKRKEHIHRPNAMFAMMETLNMIAELEGKEWE